MESQSVKCTPIFDVSALSLAAAISLLASPEGSPAKKGKPEEADSLLFRTISEGTLS